MVGPARRGARHLLSGVCGVAAFCAATAPALAAPRPAPLISHWDVTMALRITPTGAAPVHLRVALPASDALQHVGEVSVTARGLHSEVVPDGDEPHVLLSGTLAAPLRVAIGYSVERERSHDEMPSVAPLDAPPAALLPYLTPSPLFQSRSILVRDFLETNVGPLLDAPGPHDLVRSIQQVTRDKLKWAKDGKTLTLDVIRSGRAKRIGIERAFTTFLRCARVPARFVEGIDLQSTTRRKRAFWTEVWSQNQWWPISASGGWNGRLPRSWIAVARDGQRLVRSDGTASVTYDVQVMPRETPP
jgi:hypothetical protein